MAQIPERHRPALRAALDELTAGMRPEDVWAHRWTDYAERPDGTAYGSVPIWISAESPSDLSAEFEIAADGSVELTDVPVR